MKKINEKYINKIQRLLQLRKLKVIEQYRKAVKEADEADPSGICESLTENMHIYGNTSNTYIDVIQKRLIKPINQGKVIENLIQ